MVTDVFPRRNLPLEADPWGRDVESAFRDSSQRRAAVKLGVLGDSRTISGQMGAIGRQVEDLRARTTRVISAGRITQSVSIPANYGLGSSELSTVIQVPPPSDGSVRSMVVFLSGIAYNSDMVNSSGTVYASMNGIVGKPMAAPAMTSTPQGYVETASITTIIDSGAAIDLRMFLLASNMTATARTVQVGLDNVRDRCSVWR